MDWLRRRQIGVYFFLRSKKRYIQNSFYSDSIRGGKNKHRGSYEFINRDIYGAESGDLFLFIYWNV